MSERGALSVRGVAVTTETATTAETVKAATVPQNRHSRHEGYCPQTQPPRFSESSKPARIHTYLHEKPQRPKNEHVPSDTKLLLTKNYSQNIYF